MFIRSLFILAISLFALTLTLAAPTNLNRRSLAARDSQVEYRRAFPSYEKNYRRAIASSELERRSPLTKEEHKWHASMHRNAVLHVAEDKNPQHWHVAQAAAHKAAGRHRESAWHEEQAAHMKKHGIDNMDAAIDHHSKLAVAHHGLSTR